MRRRLDVPRGALRAAVSLTVLILVLFGANLLFTAREVHQAAAAAASVVQLCRAFNESQARQVAFFDHLVTIARPPQGETAAQRRQRLAETRAFVAYAHRQFAARDCTRAF